MTLRATATILALAASGLAWGQAYDPPARLAHLAYVEGQVTFDGAQEPATTTLPDRPLQAGDRLVTQDGRAEFAFGSATIRLDQGSELAILDLDEKTVRLELNAGSAYVTLRDLLEDEIFQVDTPNAAIALDEPGEYRVDVFADEASVLTVHGGSAEVATAAGEIRVAGEQRVRLEGRNALARLETLPPADAFDDWVLNREVRVAEAEPPIYTPYEEGGYESLAGYGEWVDEPRYGRVWMPNYYYGGLSPYRHGYWQRVGFGFTWINPAPWGYRTFHSGRWAYLNHLNRWCWVPERRSRRQHFAHDTRPFGPRHGDWRDRDRRHDDEPRDRPRRPRRDEPRDADTRPDRDTPRNAPRHAPAEPVAPPTMRPDDRDVWQANRDRRAVPRVQADRGERPRSTYRRDAAPVRTAPAPAPARPAATPAPSRGNATMRPARAPEARAERRAESVPDTRRSFGRPARQQP